MLLEIERLNFSINEKIVNPLAICDASNSDSTIICVVVPSVSDYPEQELERIVSQMVECFNATVPEAWEKNRREIERLKTENEIMRDWAKKNGFIYESGAA